MKYDVVIKAHRKDYYKLKHVVNSLKHLKPFPENIYIISEDGFLPQSNYTDIVIPVRDSEVYPFIDRTKIKYRPNWGWVNIVSITQEFTENDLYLDVQSDNIFIKDIDLAANNKIKIFRTNHNINNNRRWNPYFDFSVEMFGIDKSTIGTSYITEFLMYDRGKLNDLWAGYNNKNQAIEKMYTIINEQCCPADQEIYGNLLEQKYFNDYIFEDIEIRYAGGFDPPTDIELQNYIDESKTNIDYISCSYHTYWME